MSEAQRVQDARAQGEQFMFNQRENREMQKINRTAAQLDNARMPQLLKLREMVPRL